MQNLSVMIIGSGAREHAISCAYERSSFVKEIIVAPGNDFITFNRKKEVIIEKSCNLKEPETFMRLAKIHKPDLIDVAQDDALAAGTVDLLQKNGFLVFGPKKEAAKIEWDKHWSREFMRRHKIPCPAFAYFSDVDKAKNYVKELYAENPKTALYIKATGLCFGKGALKTENLQEAFANIDMMKTFGDAGKTFLIEETLKGEEFSYFVICDGKHYVSLISSKDHKTVFDHDKGSQTGGMGVVAPTLITKDREKEIEEKLIAPVLRGMKKEKLPFTGILYLGGIIVHEKPMNIEYNARWGDPECQTILPGIKTDYTELVFSCLQGKLAKINLEQDKKVRVCVVGASKGYPEEYSQVKGKQIYGIEQALKLKGISIFGSAIKMNHGKFYADGGRVLSIVAEADTLSDARKLAYSAMKMISIDGNNLHYRTDIGARDLGK